MQDKITSLEDNMRNLDKYIVYTLKRKVENLDRMRFDTYSWLLWVTVQIYMLKIRGSMKHNQKSFTTWHIYLNTPCDNQ